MVRAFWEPFAEQVERGKEEIPKNVEETDIICPVSGHPMLKRLGRNGWFLGCSGYPECKHTMPLPGESDPALELPGAGETCPECGEGTLTGKRSRYGPFLGCSRLEEPLTRFPVSAVFHGHAHHGQPEGRTRNNVPVFNVSNTLMRELYPQRPFRVVEIDMLGPDVINDAINERRAGRDRRTVDRTTTGA